MKKMMMGTTVMVTPAAIERKSELKKPWSATSPTGSVMLPWVCSIKDGHRKSFHDVTKVKMATAASDGRMTGRRMLHQMRNSLAPSMRAASMRSFGTPRKACRNRKMLKALARLGRVRGARGAEERKQVGAA